MKLQYLTYVIHSDIHSGVKSILKLYSRKRTRKYCLNNYSNKKIIFLNHSSRSKSTFYQILCCFLKKDLHLVLGRKITRPKKKQEKEMCSLELKSRFKLFLGFFTQFKV